MLPYPDFDENDLPSVARRDMSVAEERRRRRATCRFIERAGRDLDLPRVPVATAMVFFHRFFARHSFADHDRFEVAVACVLLAAKTEESPRKLTAVVQRCREAREVARQREKSDDDDGDGDGDGNGGGEGETKSGATRTTATVEPLDTKSRDFLERKERILLLERIVLHTMAFELSVDHPFKVIVDQVKKMNQAQNQKIEYEIPHKDKTPRDLGNDLVQNAVNFANDSMYTNLCLQFPARKISMACIYMSAKLCKIRPVDGKDWLNLLGVEADVLAAICVPILELIASTKKGCEKVSFDKLKKEANEVKEKKSFKRQRIS